MLGGLRRLNYLGTSGHSTVTERCRTSLLAVQWHQVGTGAWARQCLGECGAVEERRYQALAHHHLTTHHSLGKNVVVVVCGSVGNKIPHHSSGLVFLGFITLSL